MATLLVNISGGLIHLNELKAAMNKGDRLELPLKADEVKALCPDVALFEKRGRLLVSEDAELVEEPAAPVAVAELPAALVVVEAPAAPEPAPEPAPAPEAPAPVEEAPAAPPEPEAPAKTETAPEAETPAAEATPTVE